MRLALRFVGWGLFLAGLGIFIWAGGFGNARDIRMAYVGLFAALTGTILTSVSRILHSVEQRRRFREKGRASRGSLTPVEKPPDPPR